jgi:S-formylglutathione hydrolase FrmB
MKKLFMFFLFIVITISIWAGQNDILTITHFSTSLNQEKTFKVYFPPDAKADEKFPVLFVLHGAYGNYANWVDKTNIEDLADNSRWWRIWLVCR